MTIKYTIEEEDFIQYHYFSYTQSKKIQKRKRIGWFILTGCLVFLSYFSHSKGNISGAFYFGLFAVLCGLFYPRYLKWKYSKHYKRFVKATYSNQFGEKNVLYLEEDSILSKDKDEESKISYSEIAHINETENHFYLQLTSDQSLIIPKGKLRNCDEIRAKFIEKGLTLNDFKTWKW